MKNLLYYPYFEVKNINWLKFALLYFDDLRPVIPDMPYNQRRYLSDDFLRIMDETDLIKIYAPEYEEGSSASMLACEEFDNYLRTPRRYSEAFMCGYKNSNENSIDKKWRNPKFQDCILFNGKYSNNFYDYCIENNIATPCDEGIKISSDLAFVYMSFLADIISKNNGFEMITDIQKYNTLLLKNDKILSKETERNLKIAQNNIEFNIPMGIDKIDLEVFIELRKRRDFNDCRKAYMQEIRNLIEAKEKYDEGYSLEKHLSTKKDFFAICESLFNLISSINVITFDTTEIRDTIKAMPTLKSRHLARRYLATLGEIDIFTKKRVIK